MALKLSSDFHELDECLINLKELQKSLEDEVKTKNEIKVKKEEKNKIKIKKDTTKAAHQNKQICTDLDQLIKLMKQLETNLDNDDGNNKFPEQLKQCKRYETNGTQTITSLKFNTVTRLKNMKLDMHSQSLFNRFSAEKKVSYYSSLPKIVPTNDENSFTIIYKQYGVLINKCRKKLAKKNQTVSNDIRKQLIQMVQIQSMDLNEAANILGIKYKTAWTSSQTNLTQPTSDYKIPFTIYQPNRTLKTILIDEYTSAGDICQLLTARNYLMPSIRFSLVEKISHLKIERIFEDDEKPVLCLLSYPDGNNNNMIFFEDREDKYGLFTEPAKWIGSSFSNDEQEKYHIKEIFEGLVPQLPSYKSHLFYKKITRKTWKRSLCILRNSGLYGYRRSGQQNSSDLELILSLHPSLNLYTTIGGWSQCKAPTPYGFCLKTYGEQDPKYISYFCAPSEASLRYWSSMFRIALKGKTLLMNYQNQLQFVSDTLNSFQELNEIQLLPHLSKSLGCVTGRSDIFTDL